jgi:adenine phosphoribosyltransferase
VGPVSTAELAARIRVVPDFPRPGISFKDATPLMADPRAFGEVVERLREAVAAEERRAGARTTHVAAPEARGFIFGAALAREIAAGFVPARKPGKLPHTTNSAEYELEYGVDSLHTHVDAFGPGDVVVVCDDLVATGGTAAALGEMVTAAGATLLAFAFVIELRFLSGRKALDRFGVPVLSVIALDD